MDVNRARDNTLVPIEVELSEWLCDRAEQAGIDLSDTLTEALKKHLRVGP